MMKRILIALITALLFSSSVPAAIKTAASPVKNMDDVMSLGVIYINHNIAAGREANDAPKAKRDGRYCDLYYPTVIHQRAGAVVVYR